MDLLFLLAVAFIFGVIVGAICGVALAAVMS